MNFNTLLGSLFGVIAWFLLVYSYYKDHIDKILFVQILSCIFYCLSYYLFGAISGLGICAFELIKAILYYKTDADKYIFWFSLPIYFVIGYMCFDGFISLLPVIASTVDSYAMSRNRKTALVGGVISHVFWLIYDIWILAYLIVLTDVILSVSNIYLLLKKKDDIIKDVR